MSYGPRTFLDQSLMPHHYLCFVVVLVMAMLFKKTQGSVVVVSNQIGIKFGMTVLQSEYASTDAVGFLIGRYTFKMTAMTVILRLPASPSNAYHIISSLYALQFLIHSTFVLVTSTP